MADTEKQKAPLLSEVPPSAVFSAAAALCDELKTTVSTNPKKAEFMLRGAWGCVEKELHKLISHPATTVPEASVMAAALFLREYFNHAGDWDAMHVCLKKGVRAGNVTVVAINIGSDPA